MDEYLDQYFSSSSWSDVNTNERSSWDYSEPIQQNQLLPNSVGVFEEDEKNSLMSANRTTDSLAAHDRSSFVLGGELEYSIDDNLLYDKTRHEKTNQNGNGKLSSNGMMNGSLRLGNVGLQFDTTVPAIGSVRLDSPKQLPLLADMAYSFSLIDSGYAGGSKHELSEIQRSIPDMQTISPSKELWLPPSCEEVSSLSSVMGHQRTQGFCLRGTNIDSSIDTMGGIYVGMDKILPFDNLSASIIAKGKQELQSHPLSYFSAGPQTTTEGLPSLQQTAPATPTGSCNITGKPRARARRGQATDPHSIAERLRREKIAERMRNLQELVPNSNKTDKASMLDEIIDYVKFLQLQVKVLSMSRLGAAGAVLPLITDGQTEGSNGFSVSPQADQGVHISLNPDQVAFEEEVVKLMESNVTMAMQYLQSKGLCLMPIALAAAISSGKVSSSNPASEKQKKFSFSNSGIKNNSSSSSSSGSNSSFRYDGINQSLSGNTIIRKSITKSFMANGCNGDVEQEVRNTFCTGRELKPKS